jgi:hypothetical protein
MQGFSVRSQPGSNRRRVEQAVMMSEIERALAKGSTRGGLRGPSASVIT